MTNIFLHHILKQLQNWNINELANISLVSYLKLCPILYGHKNEWPLVKCYLKSWIISFNTNQSLKKKGLFDQLPSAPPYI